MDIESKAKRHEMMATLMMEMDEAALLKLKMDGNEKMMKIKRVYVCFFEEMGIRMNQKKSVMMVIQMKEMDEVHFELLKMDGNDLKVSFGLEFYFK